MLSYVEVRHPAFGFNEEGVTDNNGVIHLTGFRQECFRFIIGARLLDEFSWLACVNLAAVIAFNRWPGMQDFDDRIGQWDLDRVLNVFASTSKRNFQNFAAQAIQRGSMSLEAYSNQRVHKFIWELSHLTLVLCCRKR